MVNDETARGIKFVGMLVVVSTAKEIDREWRLVVADDEIVASSQVRVDGAISVSEGCPEKVLEFGRSMLADICWRPDPVFMLDVCEARGRLRLLELNSFSCSGLYACDLRDVVRAVSKVAERAWGASAA